MDTTEMYQEMYQGYISVVSLLSPLIRPHKVIHEVLKAQNHSCLQKLLRSEKRTIVPMCCSFKISDRKCIASWKSWCGIKVGG